MQLNRIDSQMILLDQSIKKLTESIEKFNSNINTKKGKEQIQYILMSTGQTFNSFEQAKKHEQLLGLADDIITVYPPSMSSQFFRNQNGNYTKKSDGEKS